MSAPVAAGNLWSVMYTATFRLLVLWIPKCVFRRIVVVHADSAHVAVRLSVLSTYNFRLLLSKQGSVNRTRTRTDQPSQVNQARVRAPASS